jgi:hypothetical protein
MKINHPILNALYKVADGVATVSGNAALQQKVKATEAAIDRQTDAFEARLPGPVQRALFQFGELGKKVGL